MMLRSRWIEAGFEVQRILQQRSRSCGRWAACAALWLTCPGPCWAAAVPKPACPGAHTQKVAFHLPAAAQAAIDREARRRHVESEDEEGEQWLLTCVLQAG